MIISRSLRCWPGSLVLGLAMSSMGEAEAQIMGPQSQFSRNPVSASTTAAASSSPTPFTSSWQIPTSVALDSFTTFNYTISDFDQSLVYLVLCQTSAPPRANAPVTSNTYAVAYLEECHFDGTPNPECSSNYITNGTTSNITYMLQKGQAYTIQTSLSNFFFCFGMAPNHSLGGFVCQTFSEYFDIVPGRGQRDMKNLIERTAANPPPSLVGSREPLVLNSTPREHVITYAGAGPPPPGLLGAISNTPTVAGSSTGSSSTTAPSTTGSSTAAATTAPRLPSTSKSGGLSLAAKIIIAIGALVFVCILLLLALFCLRRKHAKRNMNSSPSAVRAPQEQAMLTRSLHTDSFPHSALITEKDDFSPSSITTLPNPIQRHPNAHIPYTTVGGSSSEPAPAPYAAAADVPRRKPILSSISRGLSTISRSSSSGAGPTAGSSSGTNNFSTYRDVNPTYGDARYSPQVFASQALQEEGMTAEDVARLEEEERRIDAAIAEAEREAEEGASVTHGQGHGVAR